MRMISLITGIALTSALLSPTIVRAADETLFDRLGGMEAIEAVVSQFVDNNNADEVISQRWATADVDDLKEKLSDLVCEAAGGPCTYYGSSMEVSHAGQNITEDEFNRVAGNLVAALDQFNVPEQEKGELLAVVGSMKDQVVGK